MNARDWHRLWMALAQHLATRTCAFVEAYARRCDAHFNPYSDAHAFAREAARWASMRRRAIERADEALARSSMLRVDGGAS